MTPALEKGLLKLHLGPNERVSEELGPEESFKDGEHPSEEPHRRTPSAHCVGKGSG